MLFGALGSCPICSGSLRYSGGKYHCLGYASAWSKCSFSTTEPVRLKEKWKIPEETNNQYLSKVCNCLRYIFFFCFFKTQTFVCVHARPRPHMCACACVYCNNAKNAD